MGEKRNKNIVSWTTIKDKAARQLLKEASQGQFNFVKKLGYSFNESFLSKREINQIRTDIIHWDIRCFNNLMEVFPACFPPFVKNGHYYIDDSDWNFVNLN